MCIAFVRLPACLVNICTIQRRFTITKGDVVHVIVHFPFYEVNVLKGNLRFYSP